MFICFEMDGENFMYNVNNIISVKQKERTIFIRTVNLQDNFVYDDVEQARANFRNLKGFIDKARSQQ